MKFNITSILALLVVLSVLVGPVSAATTWNVTSDNSTSDIQGVINNAAAGDTINFTTSAGTIYNGTTGISLRVDRTLTLLGNGVTLIGNGSSIFNITDTSGVTIRDFIIDINSTSGGDGITGSNVNNCVIENNVITNGDDGINIFMQYNGLTIRNNTITNMTTGRDGISLVNHNVLENLDSLDPTLIENNIIDDVQYGIFLGGNFKGNITGNSISATVAGMNITGKKASTNGILNATICNNTINGGIAIESPTIHFLNLSYNIITGVVAGTELSIQAAYGYATGDGVDNIFVTFNEFSNNVTQRFITDANETGSWNNNTKNGVPYP